LAKHNISNKAQHPIQIMTPTICTEISKSKRTLLALGWSLLNLLTFLSFLSCFLFILLSTLNTIQKQQQQRQQGYYYYQQPNDRPNENYENIRLPFITSRAMAFTALWIMSLSAMVGIYGTVVLGFVSPLTANYYWCCSHAVHKTTPMILGAFIGSLIMYANLTLVCSVLFWEFQVMDDYWGENSEGEAGGGGGGERNNGQEGQRNREREMRRENMSRSSMAFSILCIFLTILYAGFAALVFVYSEAWMDENRQDLRREALRPTSSDDLEDDDDRPNRELRDVRRGLIGNRFTVPSPGSAVGVGDAFIRPTESGSFGVMS